VFAVTHIAETEGIFLPEGERTPEMIGRRIAEISDAKNQRRLENAFDQTSKFARIAATAAG